MDKVYKYIIQKTVTDRIDKREAVQLLELLKKAKDKNRQMDIAVIGLAAKTSRADNAREFWNNLIQGRDAIRKIPLMRQRDLDEYLSFKGFDGEAMKYRELAYLDDVDKFDWEFFNMPPKEAELMDPNQRLFLETAFTAIEEAGYRPSSLRGSRTGLYLGYITANYSYQNLLYETDAAVGASTIMANMAALIPSRVSYLLDLHGPSLLVDTTCSSSLVAVHLACQAIRTGECDQALVGGVKINLLPLLDGPKIGIESSTARTKAFDELSDGTGQGEGVGVVMLKPLQQALRDGDNVRAIIKGSAINQDGQSIGITAPNPEAQTALITDAWQAAQIDPTSISYIEAHGTGTKLGDPIEMEGLNQAFRRYTDKRQFCAVASVKTNIGHLDEAAGIFGLIKTILSLEKKQLPPSLHFHEPNHKIAWEESALFVNNKLSDWQTSDGSPLRAGVSSFGLSGTNCHVVLEEYREKKNHAKTKNSFSKNIFTLSAGNKVVLENLLWQNIVFFREENNLNLANVCYTANLGRDHQACRLAVVFSDQTDLLERLQTAIKIINEGGKAPGVFYATKKKFRKTEKNVNRFISDYGKQLVGEWHQNFDEEILRKIAEYYSQGGEIDWAKFYLDEKYQRVSLPTYPFQKKRCWFKIPNQQKKEAKFELAWRENDIFGEKIAAGKLLVFTGKSRRAQSILRLLRKKVVKADLIEVLIGKSFSRLGQGKYEIGNNIEDYQRLFKALSKEDIYQIVHLSSLSKTSGAAETFKELQDSEEKGVMSFFYLAKALRANYADKVLNLVLVSEFASQVTGQEEFLKPENAPLFGLGRALLVEFPNWRCRAIDIDIETDEKLIIEEIRSEYRHHKVAFREQRRYIEEFRNYEDVNNKSLALRPHGVYLFTGGTSAIVSELVKYLSRLEKLKFVLISRSSFLRDMDWKNIVANKELPESKRLLLENFLEARQNGSELFFYQGDVSSLDQMRAVLTEIKKDFGRINGVVHAAGVAREKEFDRKSEEEFREVLSAKIYGTWILDHLLRDQKLDFFSLFSSAITCFSGAHNGDYIAANSYLDSYAFWGRGQGINFSSVNWPFWNKVGMHVRQVINTARVPLKNISAGEGADLWFRSLGQARPGLVVVGKLNHEGRSAYLIKNSPFTFSDRIISQIEENIEIAFRENLPEPVDLHGRENYSQIEKDIAQILFEVLGYKEIDVNDNFFDLGGDSLFLAEIFYRLEKRYPGLLNITQLFAFPTVAKLAEYLSQNTATLAPKNNVTPTVEKSRDIAVIGLAAKTSLADNVDELWQNLVIGRECIRPIPETRRLDIDKYLRSIGAEEKYLAYSPLAYLSHIDQFDYEFFKFSPREAKLMDPNHRLFLETAISAMEEAGYGGDKLRGSNTGLYLGYGPSDFEYKSFISNSKFATSTALFTGNLNALIPSRISYLLDLRGPSMVIDTACSSSLVAVHLACQALLAGDCEQALVGGVRLNLVPLMNRFKVGIESSDWYTRTFDNASDGTGMGEGVAALLLKPLDQALTDGDQIHAVIKGSAINQDGQSVGITAPNTRAQAEVLESAWENARINPEEISYIEAHGTGTSLGDPIEIQGITTAFRRFTDKKQFCAISAIKPNLGHTLEAAGIFSLIKAILSLEKKLIPPTINFHEPNHRVDWENSAVFVNDHLLPWDNNLQQKRYCGVSSFGLSGTNCHVVLGEAPEKNVTSAIKSQPNVFTISAKNISSLKNLVNQYVALLKREEKISLVDLCYTANTGRGHYEERLALITENTQDLLAKLQKMQKSNFRQPLARGCYYGQHKIIPENKKIEKKGEISIAEIRQLSIKIEPVMRRLAESRVFDIDNCHQLGQAYVKGAKIDWEKLYKKQTSFRISLPTYPFTKSRAWAEMDDQIQVESLAGNLQFLHPLLEKCLVKSSEQDIYATSFSAKKHFVLGDHIINGSHVLPGTVYLEIAKQIGRLYYGELPLEVKNLSFITPVITNKEERKEVQIVVEEKGGFKKFFAISQRLAEDGTGQWLRHVEGEIHPRTDLFLKKVSLSEIQARCRKKHLVIDINKNAAGFIEFGPRWQNYHAIDFGDKEALAELELPRECVHDLETYFLHPPMLDMAAAAVSMATGFKALPFSYGSFRTIAPLTKKIYSYFKRIGDYDETEETVSFDFDLLDAEGRVLAEVENFKLKRTRDFTRVIQRNKSIHTNKFYRAYWEAVERPIIEEPRKVLTLVFEGQTKRAQALADSLKKNNEIISVSFGEFYKKKNENEFLIRNCLEDYETLIRQLKDRSIKRIVHLSSLWADNSLASAEGVLAGQSKRVFSFFYLIKALTTNIVKEKLDIVIVSEYSEKINGKEKNIRPENAALVGFGKAPILEDSNWQCRSIDIDDQTSLEEIRKEIEADYLSYKCAWRDGIRYSEELRHFNPENVVKNGAGVITDGVYLITGGTGGVGMEIATRLAKTASVKLVLLNRTKVPTRDKWPEIISSQNPNDQKFKRIIKKIEELEKLGASVRVIKADISDYEEAEKAWREIKKEFGRVNGIIHAAGVPGDGFIAYKDEATLRNVLIPKLVGTWVLDQISSEENLDFFVLFSSSTSLHSAPGQSDYTAANAFLDSYGQYRNRQGRRTLVINWAGWKEVGMLSNSRTLVNYGTLSNEEASRSFLTVLDKDIDQIVIGALTYVKGVLFSQERFPLELSTEIKAEIFRVNLERERLKERNLPQQIKLKGGSGEYQDLEKELAQIWSEVLGIAEIDINDHFFDLGGDSLRIAEVHSLLEKKYPGRFSVAELFAYPTINKLVKHVESQSILPNSPVQEKSYNQEQTIAIIGMAAQSSEAENIDKLWENLANGRDSIRVVPETRRRDMDNFLRFRGLDKKYQRYSEAAYLEEIDKFDYEFFRISPREAQLTDPNQRVLLQNIYHCLENAGYGGGRLFGTKTGLYVGLFPLGSRYYDMIGEIEPTALSEAMVNNMEPTIASRVSYYLNLTGPSMLVNTACSSSLVAVHLACQAIRNGDCEQAIVGSVKISLLSLADNPKVGIESRDGHTRTFDNDSDGTGLGEGVASIILKPLSAALRDGDNVLALIKGSAINQDGQSVGITAPNSLAQTELLLSAWEGAKVAPDTITYIEAHGTGTNLGDPIEIQALSEAFRKYTNKKQFCAVSSVKANLGHLLEAAGIFGLIKAVMSLQKEKLAPAINLHEPNGKINWEESPVYINDKLQVWPRGSQVRRAGVSSFGLSGTNCHILLEEAPLLASLETSETSLKQIFVLSARHHDSLRKLITEYIDHFRLFPNLDLESICYTASTGRAHQSIRLALTVSSLEELASRLQNYLNNNYGKSTDGIFFQEFKIIPSGSKLKPTGELTEKESLALGTEMELIAQELFFGQRDNQTLLDRFCQAYVDGANFDWLKLYRDKKYQKVSLPLYPFARERCWLDVPGAEKFSGYYQATEWIPQKNNNPEMNDSGSVLIFGNKTRKAEELVAFMKKAGRDVIKVSIGARFRKINKNNYQISLSKEDYRRLWQELSERKISKIIHLLSLSDKKEIKELVELERSQELGVKNVLTLVQTLSLAYPQKSFELFLVSEYFEFIDGQDLVKPENASLVGFGKAVVMENPNLHCHAYDWDDKTSINLLAAEIDHPTKDYKVVFRSNQRYIEQLKALDISDYVDLDLAGEVGNTFKIRENGLYIITGGTGGIGLEIARSLSEQAKTNLVLLARKALPEKAKWSEILHADGPKDQRLLRQIENLQAIEENGSKVIFVIADVTDDKQMEKALKDLRKKYGKINGIVHAAGRGGEGFIVNKGTAELNRVLSPKINGCWILEHLTRQDDLDFFVLFSSAITLMSGLGVSDYTAANAYLDAFAYYAKLMQRRVLTINWATWENVGLSFGEEVNEKKQLLKILPRKTAPKIFLELIKKPIVRVAVGQINFEGDLMYLGDYLPLNFSEEIKNKTRKSLEIASRQKRQISLRGGQDGQYTSLEKSLAAIWSEVLGYQEIDIRGNFFELGGDSLSGIRLMSRISQQLNRTLSFREILQYPTLQQMAVYLAQAEKVSYKPVIKKVNPKKYNLS